MNGRVYEPTLGRFLSPDPMIQFPANMQSYNRYGYVLNNPLSFTDPSGFIAVDATYPGDPNYPGATTLDYCACNNTSQATNALGGNTAHDRDPTFAGGKIGSFGNEMGLTNALLQARTGLYTVDEAMNVATASLAHLRLNPALMLELKEVKVAVNPAAFALVIRSIYVGTKLIARPILKKLAQSV